MPRTELKAPAKPKKGDLIGEEFEVLKQLGTGGNGSVYLCRWTKRPDKEVALKLLDPGGDYPRFKREAQVLKGTNHRNVVRYLGSGMHGDRPFLVLEYVEQGSLRDLMDRRPQLPPREAAWLLIQAIRGLRAAKTVHRDLKPENLLIAKGPQAQRFQLKVGDTQEGAIVKVADFGLAKDDKFGGTMLTRSDQVMGTPVYMSPEQCRSTKKVSVKTDVYALGVLFFELIVGKPPFDAPNAYDIMAMHCNDEPKFPRMDADAKAVVARCMEKMPGKRYASLAALEKDLLRIAGVAPKGGGGRAVLAIVVILFVVAAILAVAFHERIIEYFR